MHLLRHRFLTPLPLPLPAPGALIRIPILILLQIQLSLQTHTARHINHRHRCIQAMPRQRKGHLLPTLLLILLLLLLRHQGTDCRRPLLRLQVNHMVNMRSPTFHLRPRLPLTAPRLRRRTLRRLTPRRIRRRIPHIPDRLHHLATRVLYRHLLQRVTSQAMDLHCQPDPRHLLGPIHRPNTARATRLPARTQTLIHHLHKDGVRILAATGIHVLETTGIDAMTGTKEGGTSTTDGAMTTVHEGVAIKMRPRLQDPLPTHGSIHPNRSRIPRLKSPQLQRLKVPLQLHNRTTKKN